MFTSSRPATRVGNWVIFEGGLSRELTRWERFRLFLRLPVYVGPPHPRDGWRVHV